MQKWIMMSLIGITVITGAGLAARARRQAPVRLPELKAQPVVRTTAPAADEPVAPSIAPPAAPAKTGRTASAQAAAEDAQPISSHEFAVRAADYLLNPEAAYEHRRELLGRLRQENQLTGVVAEMEKRAAEDPKNPAIPANLGQAYLLQASLATNSIAEQGMLGLKADQTFDRALALDENNWDARYWKAVAMAHWPSVLNKSRDVMENFVKLIQFQESEPQQPQFAETYSWLGK